MNWSWTDFDGLTARELYTVLQLRQAVFVVEQTCPYLDADGRDEAAWHLRGLATDGTLVAYLRAFGPDADGYIHLGRVIVAGARRGEGLGYTLMRHGAARALDQWGPHPIHLSAQAHLAAFYGTLGYTVVGEPYLEDDIPHIAMQKPFSSP
ncbi:MAG: GNAT family N-acetyltransferase [Myxococcota bacterium]